MAGTVWFDRKRVKAALRAAEIEALDTIGDAVATDARRRAPIRKVFKERPGWRRKFRPLTPEEKQLAIERAQNYYTKVDPDEFKRRRAIGHIRNYATAVVPRRGSVNAPRASHAARQIGYRDRDTGRLVITSPGTIANRQGGFYPGEEMRAKMTKRAIIEMGKGRARQTRSGSIHEYVDERGLRRIQVGGALKASIGNEGAHRTSTGAMTEVSADIHYAKFVEFPTIRTRAQPFLLPAMHDARRDMVGIVAGAIRSRLGR